MYSHISAMIEMENAQSLEEVYIYVQHIRNVYNTISMWCKGTFGEWALAYDYADGM